MLFNSRDWIIIALWYLTTYYIIILYIKLSFILNAYQRENYVKFCIPMFEFTKYYGEILIIISFTN